MSVGAALVRVRHVVLVAIVGLGLPSAASAARAGSRPPVAPSSGWSAPVGLAPAVRGDDSELQVAAASAGAAAAAFTVSDADVPGSQRAWLTARAVAGSARAVPGAAQVLSLAYRGRSLRMLLGSTQAGLDCCGAVAAASVVAGGVPGGATPLVSGLAGATEGRLVALGGGRMLAAVATERGVWAAQTGPGGAFGPARQISPVAQEPVVMDAAWLGGGRSLVAWSAGTGVAGEISPRTIDIAAGSTASAPRRARPVITVPAGHRVDELTVLRRGSGASLAWLESWSDRQGFHSRVEVADLGGAHPRSRALSPAGRLAAGVSAAGDPAGDEAVAWEACTVAASCTVQVAGRAAGRAFGVAHTLGAADATTAASLAISPAGQVIVGWVRAGQPVASVGFGAPTDLSGITTAFDVEVTYASSSSAFAAWSQGTRTTSVAAARYRASAASSTSRTGGAAASSPAPEPGNSAAATTRARPVRSAGA